MRTTLLALDVTQQARAAGFPHPVALSAAILAQFKDADVRTLEAFHGALVAVVLLGGHERTPLGPGAWLVAVKGRRYVVLERARDTDGAPAFVVLAPIEVALAGTLEVEIDVKERVERKELLQ